MRRRHRVAAAVALALVAGCSAPAAQVPTTRTIAVRTDQETVGEITANWSVAIPPGATGSADAQLTAAPPRTPEAGPANARVLATAELTLSSGQPQRPLSFSYRMDEPVPPDQVVYLLDDDSDLNDFAEQPLADAPVTSTRVHLAELSADRRTATVSGITHLSVKTWVMGSIGALTKEIGGFFGQRFDPPRCTEDRPEWLRDAVFVQDPNAPMLVCIGRDARAADAAVVKIVNNRGTGLVVSAPITPARADLTVIGADAATWVPDLLGYALGRIGASERARERTWVLSPGRSLELSFTEEQVQGAAGPLRLVGEVTPEAAALGVLAQAVAAQVNDPEAFTAWELGLLAVCGQGVLSGIRADLSSTVEAVGAATRCAIEQAPAVVDLLIDRLPPDAWARIGGRVVRSARVAKRFLAGYLAVGQAAFIATDFATTFAFGEDVLTISLFARPASGDRKYGCRGYPKPPTAAAAPDTALDLTGDACGQPGDPQADLESVTWSVGADRLTITATFAPPTTGAESFGVSFGTSPADLDAPCTGAHLSVHGDSARVITGCEERGWQTLHNSTPSRDGRRLSASVPLPYLPISADGLHLRVTADTTLSPTTSTFISDWLPDQQKPPLRIAVP